jgi:transcription initiation factor TFIIB
MEDFQQHYDFLNTLEAPEKKDTILKCCEKKENFQGFEGVIKCKECLNTISNISDSPEWRYYGSNDSKNSDPTRCGMPVNNLLPESSVGSSISFNSNGKTMNQIRKYQQYNQMPYKERSLYKVFCDIAIVCKKSNIPTKIQEEAKSLYKIVSTTKISRGSNRQGIIAACVYFACKECNVPRSSKEVSEMFSLSVTVMTKGVKKCQEIIFMNKSNKQRLTTKNSIQPIDFIDRFCNKLELTNEEQIDEIKEICNIAIRNNIITENTPPSIASGSVYFYVKYKGLEINRKNISDVCKISEVTINKCSKKLEDNKELFSNIMNYAENE